MEYCNAIVYIHFMLVPWDVHSTAILIVRLHSGKLAVFTMIKRNAKHFLVIFEDMSRTFAMMNIEIYDQNSGMGQKRNFVVNRMVCGNFS